MKMQVCLVLFPSLSVSLSAFVVYVITDQPTTHLHRRANSVHLPLLTRTAVEEDSGLYCVCDFDATSASVVVHEDDHSDGHHEISRIRPTRERLYSVVE